MRSADISLVGDADMSKRARAMTPLWRFWCSAFACGPGAFVCVLDMCECRVFPMLLLLPRPPLLSARPLPMSVLPLLPAAVSFVLVWGLLRRTRCGCVMKHGRYVVG